MHDTAAPTLPCGTRRRSSSKGEPPTKRAGAALAGALALAFATSAASHEAAAAPGGGLAGAWSADLGLWALWGLPGLLALVGIARLWRHAGAGQGVGRRQALAFLAGWLGLGLALLSPLDALGKQLFWVHMVQHEVMMLVAAPLLVLGRPLGALAWGLPAGWRPGAARLARWLGLAAAVRILTRPLVAWTVHAAALWAWHAPALFGAALRVRWLHELQHASFLVSALAFWWVLLQVRGRGREGPAVLYLLTTLLHTGVLGALLTFGEQPWYAGYEGRALAWGLSALEDQQLGGLIMWVPGGAAYLVAALALCAAWLRAGDSRAPGWRTHQ